MPYTPVLATLAYVLSPDRRRVLMVHRNRRPDDAHFGKYNGLGGKVERDEDVVAGVRREVREEAAIECDGLRLRGTVSWPGFGTKPAGAQAAPAPADWLGFIFLVEHWHGTPLTENPEGTLEWVAVDSIAGLPLWEGDKFFLPLVFADRPGQFHGVMPYENGRPVGWSYSWLDA